MAGAVIRPRPCWNLPELRDHTVWRAPGSARARWRAALGPTSEIPDVATQVSDAGTVCDDQGKLSPRCTSGDLDRLRAGHENRQRRNRGVHAARRVCPANNVV